MTDEQIIEMARQVGIKRRTDKFFSEYCDGIYDDDLKAFAKLVAQHEREACAKVCDEHPGYMTGIVSLKIRARGEA